MDVNKPVYDVLCTKGRRLIATTNDPGMVAFYANIGYVTRMTRP